LERNHRMELQYDGTGLSGWAKQDGLRTVEGCLEEAFRTALGHAPLLRVAGRTDAGVHARRQVVSLLLPEEVDLFKLRRSLNALTPAGIAVLDVRRAPVAFDARRDATSRGYRYFLCFDPVMSPFWGGYCWQVFGSDLDVGQMAEAAALVAGRHRFTAFTPNETKHVFFDRTVLRCRWTRPGGAALPAAALGRPATGGPAGKAGRDHGGLLCLEIEADAFLRHMVRALVGTMVEVGRGERSLEEFARLLDGATREAAGLTAPPHGLFLWDIKYGRGGMKRPPYGKIPGEPACGPAGGLIDETADSEA
jgi:tRNA pseudouridine38-40 synthase